MSAAEAAQAAALASYALEPAALSAHGSDDAAGSTTDVLGSTMPPSVYDVRYAWEAADVFLQEEDGRGATTVMSTRMTRTFSGGAPPLGCETPSTHNFGGVTDSVDDFAQLLSDADSIAHLWRRASHQRHRLASTDNLPRPRTSGALSGISASQSREASNHASQHAQALLSPPGARASSGVDVSQRPSSTAEAPPVAAAAAQDLSARRNASQPTLHRNAAGRTHTHSSMSALPAPAGGSDPGSARESTSASRDPTTHARTQAQPQPPILQPPPRAARGGAAFDHLRPYGSSAPGSALLVAMNCFDSMAQASEPQTQCPDGLAPIISSSAAYAPPPSFARPPSTSARTSGSQMGRPAQPDSGMLRGGQDSLPDALHDLSQFSDFVLPSQALRTSSEFQSGAVRVTNPKLTGLPGLDPIYRSGPPRQAPTLAHAPPDGGDLRARSQSVREQGSAHNGTAAMRESSSRVSFLGGSLRGESAAETTLHLRLFSEILFSAGMNDLAQIQRLIKRHKVDITAVCDYDGRTPLHLAASEGAFATTEWLLAQGARVDAVDRFGRTPLMDALLAERTPVAQFLLEVDAPVYEGGVLKPAAQSAAFGRLAGTVAHSLLHVMHPDYEIAPADLDLGEVLGEGEYGVVYRARWHGAPVAVKVLKSSEAIPVQEFAAELAMLLSIHHPHTVQFVGAVTQVEPFMIVTECMEGGSLEAALRGGARFSLRRALEVALDCARGLSYLHLPTPNEVIHRDLKPSNVMFAGSGTAMGARELALDTGTAKLADFGLSKTLNIARPRAAPQGKLQDDGTYVVEVAVTAELDEGGGGTNGAAAARSNATDNFKLTGGTGSYLYMAGEVFRHEPYNAQADVYSFAMILYEMVTGQWPFRGMEPMQAAMRAATDGLRPHFPLAPPPHFSDDDVSVLPAVQRLIEQCWDAHPNKRPACEQIITRIEDMLTSFAVPRRRYADVVAAEARALRASRSRRSFQFGKRPEGTPLGLGGLASLSFASTPGSPVVGGLLKRDGSRERLIGGGGALLVRGGPRSLPVHMVTSRLFTPLQSAGEGTCGTEVTMEVGGVADTGRLLAGETSSGPVGIPGGAPGPRDRVTGHGWCLPWPRRTRKKRGGFLGID